jgi:hypothetical protein
VIDYASLGNQSPLLKPLVCNLSSKASYRNAVFGPDSFQTLKLAISLSSRMEVIDVWNIQFNPRKEANSSVLQFYSILGLISLRDV